MKKKLTPENTFAALKRIPLDLGAINYSSFEMEEINRRDYPDFCDAFISYAEFLDGVELTEDQMEQLNENSDIVYEAAIGGLY